MKTKNLKQNLKQQKDTQEIKGFTLVETLIAIFILVLSVTGPMSAAQNSLKASFLARDQIAAFYLAQDAIEYLRNEKDTNMILKLKNPGNGIKILKQAIIASCKDEPCEIDTTITSDEIASAVKKCSSSGCSPLYFDTNTKQYETSIGGSDTTPSKFTREIYIDEIGNTDDEYKVTVVIKWQPNFFSPRRIVVQENLYNWLSIN